MMDGYQNYSAGSHHEFNNTFNNDMDLDMNQAEYSDLQPLHHQQLPLTGYEQSPMGTSLLLYI
jgi:hypothetical protein